MPSHTMQYNAMHIAETPPPHVVRGVRKVRLYEATQQTKSTVNRVCNSVVYGILSFSSCPKWEFYSHVVPLV